MVDLVIFASVSVTIHLISEVASETEEVEAVLVEEAAVANC